MSDPLATYLHDHLAGSHFAVKLLDSLVVVAVVATARATKNCFDAREQLRQSKRLRHIIVCA